MPIDIPHMHVNWLLSVFLVSLTPVHTFAEDIKVGILLCLSGECASEGTQSLRGVQLAVEQANSTGILGSKLQLVVEDSAEGMSGAHSVTAYKKLRTDPGLHILIGPSWSTAALALAPLIARDESIVAITPTVGVADYHRAGANIFNARGTSETTTRALAQLARKRGFETAAILSSQQAWELDQGNYFADEFTKLGGKMLVKVETLASSTDIKPFVLKVAAAKPSLIFMASLVQMPLASKELRRLDFKAALFAAHVDRDRIDQAEGTLENILFASYPEASSDFVIRYKQRFNSNPEMPAATGYDAVKTLLLAINRAGSSDPKALSKQIPALEFFGASGKIAYDADGCAVKPVQFWTVKGSQSVLVAE